MAEFHRSGNPREAMAGTWAGSAHERVASPGDGSGSENRYGVGGDGGAIEMPENQVVVLRP